MNEKAKSINKIDYAGVILHRDNKFLLQLRDNRKNIPNPNKWAIFGGGVKRGEKPIKTVLREIREELGLQLIPRDVKPIMTIRLFGKKYYIFKSLLKKDPIYLTLHEGQDMKLFSKKEILLNRNVLNTVKIFFLIYFILNHRVKY